MISAFFFIVLSIIAALYGYEKIFKKGCGCGS